MSDKSPYDGFDVTYATRATAKGGRLGQVKTEDGKLDLQLSMPKSMGGDDGPGTNPEQLFACGYSACYLSALKAVARGQKLTIDDATVTATITMNRSSQPKFRLSAELAVQIPGVEKSKAQELIEAAHQLCPYSEATRGNIDVRLRLV